MKARLSNTPRVLLVTPPMTQLNAPYAAGPALAGTLHARGWTVEQVDLSLELALALFSRQGLTAVRRVLARAPHPGPCARGFLRRAPDYLATVGPALRFLQGRDPGAAWRITGRAWLPEGPRFAAAADPAWLDHAFGAMGVQDRARFLASLYLDDLADVIREGVDPRFELARFGADFALHAPEFDPLRRALRARPTLVERLLNGLVDAALERAQPDLVGLTVPFPGTLYGAFRVAARVKRVRPTTAVALGGGYVSSELRGLADPRVFDYVDYVVLDDGERPLLALLEQLHRPRARPRLRRTFLRRGGRVVFLDDPTRQDLPHARTGPPRYAGLPPDDYLALCELPNPMHRLWSGAYWNKLVLARGCYWHRCSFCDNRLPCISRYDPAPARRLVEWIEHVRDATGRSGFHFTDEAAPPDLLRALARELIARRLPVTWWTNIRFEPAFTPALLRLLADSGCVALTGGLEAAQNRLLRLIRKGITVEGAARVMQACADAGVMVHAYLMYGLPTQTIQETVDALEIVRQLFAAGCLQSAYWHRFALSAHSPMAAHPAAWRMRVSPPAHGAFAQNEIPWDDPARERHHRLGEGLRRATYNFMHGIGLDQDVRRWWTGRMPRPRVAPDFIRRPQAAR